MNEQQSIQFGFEDNKPFIRIFDNDMKTITYRLRASQVPVILHDIAKLVWDKFTLVPRD